VLLFFRYDDLPEMAFYMVGDITEVQEKADKMAKEIAARRVRYFSGYMHPGKQSYIAARMVLICQGTRPASRSVMA
jgi:hypothetical protein